MTTHIGREGLVKILTNTVTEIKGFSIDEANNPIEDSELSDTDSTFKAGRNSWTASIECHWDDTDTTGQGAMTIGAEVTVNFGPEGDGLGAYQASGTALITGKGLAVADEGVTAITFTLQGSGPLTVGAF